MFRSTANEAGVRKGAGWTDLATSALLTAQRRGAWCRSGTACSRPETQSSEEKSSWGASRNEPAWNLVSEGETIPYETAFLRPGPAGPRVRAHARELAARQQPH